MFLIVNFVKQNQTSVFLMKSILSQAPRKNGSTERFRVVGSSIIFHYALWEVI